MCIYGCGGGQGGYSGVRAGACCVLVSVAVQYAREGSLSNVFAQPENDVHGAG